MRTHSNRKASQSVAASKPKFDFHFLIYILYLAVFYIPALGSVEIIGPQWLYLSVLNLLVLLLILFDKNRYGKAFSLVLKQKATILFIVFLLWASFSITYALNKPETLVCLARLFTHVIAFVNIAVLAMGRLDHLKKVFVLFSIMLFGESIYTIYSFFQYLPEATDLTGLIIGHLAGNTGNKNIMAASILVKIPFCLYCVYISKFEGRILHLISLFFGLLALFILNTRSVYVSLIVILVIYLIYCFSEYRKNKMIVELLLKSSYLWGTIIISVIVSQIIITSARDTFTNQASGYGTVTERIGTINFSNESSSSRLDLWKAAVAFTKKHPIFGGGYGNWKVFSTQYTSEWLDDLHVPHHSHNDFIETTAELGLVGGLLYLAIFICLAFYILQIWRSKTSSEIKTIATFLLMGLVGYAIDAALNFPAERTVMQVLFEIIIGFIIVLSVMSKVETREANRPKTIIMTWFASAYISLMLLFSIPSIGVNYLTFQSYKGQLYLISEINKEPTYSLAQIQGFFANANTKIPNLTIDDLAIDAAISRYYIKEKKFDSAIILLDKSKIASPYLYYNEFLKGFIYIQKNKFDSAYKYFKLAFYKRPRSKSYFTNMMLIAFNQGDTAEYRKVFNTYIKYRNESYPYKIYLNGMVDLTRNNDQGLLELADSAIKLFPADTANLKDINAYRNILVNRINMGAVKTNNPIVSVNNDAQLVMQYVANAFAAYNKNEFTTSAALFIKASKLDPSNYAHNENAGICYFSNKEYNKAIPYLDKAINSGKATTGKSEYFKGLILIQLGNKTGGCELLHKAKEKNYAEADAFIKGNCN
jgi:O-antigen ligase/tetratricopeptide (TPR) repeat protein